MVDGALPGRSIGETGRVSVAVLALAAIPWSVQTFVGGEVLLRFVWGAVSFEPTLFVATLATYPLLSGPPVLVWWLTAAACWLGALVSAVAGLIGREDPRVTAGLLAVAGGANLLVALEFGVQPGRTGWPVGTLGAWIVAAWRYRVGRTATAGRH